MRAVLFHRRVHKKIREKALPGEQIAKCVRLLSQGQTDHLGLRMKRLKGVNYPVFEARVNRDVRLIFTVQPAHAYTKENGEDKDHLISQLVVWDIDHHDDALHAARRIRYDSLQQAEHLNLETALHPDGVLEEIEVVKLPEYPTVPLSVVEGAVRTGKSVLRQYVRLSYRGEDWWLEKAIETERESLYDAQEFWEVDLHRIEEEIESIARSDEDFLLRLLPEQMEYVRMPGPLLLSGTVGSGKTTIMLYHLYRQARANPAGRYLVVTYSPTLTRLCYLLFAHLPQGRDLLKRVDILSYEALLHRQFPDSTVVSYAERRRQFHEAYQRAKEVWRLGNLRGPLRSFQKRHKELPWDEETLWAEYWDVIKGQLNWQTRQLLDQEGYLYSAASALSPEEREAVWAAVQMWFQFEKADELDLSRRLWEDPESVSAEYDGVYVDEIQDLCEVQWMLLMRLVTHHAGLFFTGDPFQALRPSGFHWNRLVSRLSQKVEVREGSLQLNLRNSRQIAQFVQTELERVRAKYALDEMPDYHVTARLEGLHPVCAATEQYVADPTPLAKWLGDQGVVIVWDEEDKDAPLAQSLQQHVPLCCVEEAKGLEFDRALLLNIYGCMREQMRQSQVLRRQAFSRLYVALTRARRGLIIVEDRSSDLPPALAPLTPEWLDGWNAVETVVVRSCEVIRCKYEQEGYEKAAVIYEQMGDYANAARCYEQAGKHAEAARCWGEFYERQDNWLEAAQWFEKAALFARAAQCYEQAGQHVEAARCYDQVGDYANAARCYERAGDYAKAGQRYEKARDYANAAHCYEQVGDYAKAGQCYEKAKDYANAARCYEQAGQHAEAAWCYERAGDYANAARCYEQAGQHAEAARCGGEFYERQGNWSEAARWFEKARLFDRAARCYEQAGQHAEAARCGGEFYESQGNWSEAARWFEKARLFDRAARCYERAGDYANAARCYEQAGQHAEAARRYDQAGDYANAARCYKQVGGYAKAAQCYEKARDYANAAQCYEQAGQHAEAAWCYERAGDYAKAARCYEQAGQHAEAARCYERVEDYANAAQCYERAGDYAKAGQFYEKARDYANAARCYEQAGQHAEAARCGGKFYARQGNWLEAAQWFEKAGLFARAARCYEELKDYNNAARCYERAGDYANAARCYERVGEYGEAAQCYEQAGQHAEAARCWGEFYARQGNWLEAARWFEKARLFDRVAQCYEQAGQHAEAAWCYERAGDYAKAARCYEHVEDYANAARCYERVEDYANAARCYERVGDYANAAWCYEQAGDYAKAARCYEQAGQHAEAAWCYERAGDYAKAARCYEQVGGYAKAGQCYEKAKDHANAARCYEQARKPKEAARCWGKFYER
jgi:tetratricopeptide (TPR) repeat protein/mRNA-degrading endonuclease YafQ of YafQ-DinJ toxin-antitoxin module